MSRSSRLQPALAGLLGAGVALAIAELLAGLLPGGTSLVAAIGQLVIDLQPPGAKDLVVALFGENDKIALEIGIVIVAVSIGAGFGLLARRRFLFAVLGFAAFGVVGFVASLRGPFVEPVTSAAVSALAVASGLQALTWLMGPGGGATGAIMPDWSRREFLVRGSAIGVVALSAGVGGRALIERIRTAPAGSGDTIPPPSTVLDALPAGTDLAPDVPGLTSIVVPNDSFYRIDTALLVPTVDTASWTLRIHGMVDRETTLTWDELVGLPQFEQYVTIACVSNEVGGRLVGNAKWTGVRLRDVLDIAGVQDGATQLVGRSVDGWTAGMPTAWVMDPSREPMIAVRMNDEPLPPSHGFPARLIVPGLYGYVSATKWLSELQLTTLEGFHGYWVPLGWAKEAPILTQSRIDTPRHGARVPAGTIPIAGVAWAPDRGVQRVEVAVDGVWSDARLSAPISDTTWVQWVYDWPATSGRHAVAVRATDGRGEVQTETRSRPDPDGARGWHTITVDIG